MAILLVLAPRALAERAGVVLAEVPAELEQATRTTLESWNLRVISITTILPADQDRAMQHARTLAKRHRAGAVVWLASAPDGQHALWLYDIRHERLISRALAIGPPFDEPGAAAVALSIKTLLLHSTVAPKDQRIAPISNARPDRTSSTSVAPDQGRSSTPSAPDRSSSAPSTPAPRPSAPSYIVEGRVQVRSTYLTQRIIEPRFSAGLGWWPRVLEHRYGVSVHVEVGPEAQVKTELAARPEARVKAEALRGQFRDMALSLALHRRFQVRSRIYAVAGGGVSMHFTRLGGVFTAGSGRIEQHKTNPSLDIGLQVFTPLSRRYKIDLAIRAFASTRWQEHPVEGRSILETPVLDLGTGLGLTIALD